MDELREIFIDQEIDDVLRQSPLDQMKSIEKLGTIKIIDHISDLPDFLEIFERRNIIVHAGGRISRKYIESSKKYKFKIDEDLKLGDSIGVNKNYFDNAVNRMISTGILISLYICWKFDPEGRKENEAWMINYIYSKINDGNFFAADKMIGMVESAKYNFTEETLMLMFILNKAQCKKWMNENKECEQILSTIDWSAKEHQFKLCVSILREDYIASANLIRTIGKNGAIDFENYCTWPIFKRAREVEDFKIAVKEVFGRPLEQISQTKLEILTRSSGNTGNPSAKKVKNVRRSVVH